MEKKNNDLEADSNFFETNNNDELRRLISGRCNNKILLVEVILFLLLKYGFH